MTLKFEPYDSVIVQSIYFGQGWFRTGATLKKIVMLTDALDRSTIQYGQIADVLTKLLTADLVRVSGDKIFLTKKYRQLRRQSNKSHPKLERETDRIKVILKGVEKQNFDNRKSLPDNFLPEWKWEMATNQYRSQF